MKKVFIEYLQHLVARILNRETIVIHQVPLSLSDRLYFYFKSGGRIIYDSFKSNIKQQRSNIKAIFTYTGHHTKYLEGIPVYISQHGGKYGFDHVGTKIDKEAYKFYGWGSWCKHYLPPCWDRTYKYNPGGIDLAVLPNDPEFDFNWYYRVINEYYPEFKILDPYGGFSKIMHTVKTVLVFDTSTVFYQCLAQRIPVILFPRTKPFPPDAVENLRRLYCNQTNNWREVWLKEFKHILKNKREER